MIVAGTSRAPLLLQSNSRTALKEAIQGAQQEKTGSHRPSVALDARYGSKLADAMWFMESNGVVLEQQPTRTALSKDDQPDAGVEFLQASKMTPVERIRYFFMEDRELNENKLAARSEKDRGAIEQQIKNIILQ